MWDSLFSNSAAIILIIICLWGISRWAKWWEKEWNSMTEEEQREWREKHDMFHT